MNKLLLKDTASLLQRGKRTEELEKKKKKHCHDPKWDCELMEGRVVKIFYK